MQRIGRLPLSVPRIQNFLPDPDLLPEVSNPDPGLDPKLDVNTNENHQQKEQF
jgi:hypothetical protein